MQIRAGDKFDSLDDVSMNLNLLVKLENKAVTSPSMLHGGVGGDGDGEREHELS